MNKKTHPLKHRHFLRVDDSLDGQITADAIARRTTVSAVMREILIDHYTAALRVLSQNEPRDAKKQDTQ